MPSVETSFSRHMHEFLILIGYGRKQKELFKTRSAILKIMLVKVKGH